MLVSQAKSELGSIDATRADRTDLIREILTNSVHVTPLLGMIDALMGQISDAGVPPTEFLS